MDNKQKLSDEIRYLFDLHKRFRQEMALIGSPWTLPWLPACLSFSCTEAAKVLDARLREGGEYARNNDKPADMLDELGDLFIMLLSSILAAQSLSSPTALTVDVPQKARLTEEGLREIDRHEKEKQAPTILYMGRTVWDIAWRYGDVRMSDEALLYELTLALGQASLLMRFEGGFLTEIVACRLARIWRKHGESHFDEYTHKLEAIPEVLRIARSVIRVDMSMIYDYIDEYMDDKEVMGMPILYSELMQGLRREALFFNGMDEEIGFDGEVGLDDIDIACPDCGATYVVNDDVMSCPVCHVQGGLVA